MAELRITETIKFCQINKQLIPFSYLCNKCNLIKELIRCFKVSNTSKTMLHFFMTPTNPSKCKC